MAKAVEQVVVNSLLGFALGFSLSGTIDHFFIPPKPVKALLQCVREAQLDDQSKQIIGTNLEDLKFVRNNLLQTEWDGTIGKNQATINCKLCSDSSEVLAVGRFVRRYNSKTWKPLFVSVSANNKDIILFNVFRAK